MAKRKKAKKVKRKVAKKKTTKKKTVKKKRKGPAKPFGGMMIKPDASLGALIGKAAVTPSQMTKKLWAYIKKKRLLKR